MYSMRTIALAAVAAILATAALIYLTPLKWVNVIEPRMHDIDAAQFYRDFEANPDKYVFIDVRTASAYDTLYAKGSVNHPIANLFDIHETLPRSGKEIVLICSTGRLAGIAYGYLEREGFQNLLRIEGGLQAWVLAGLPVEGSNIHAVIQPD